METDDNSLSGTFADTIDKPSYNPGNGPLFVNRNPRNSAGQLYFNPNYFVTEPVGQVGNAKRRFFSGPGIYNFDMALLKDTRITESMQVQFRAEAFNIFNHAQFMNPSGNINDTGGRVCDFRSRSTPQTTRSKVFVLKRVTSMLSSPRSRSVLAPVLAVLWAANGLAAWSQGPQKNLPQKNVKSVSTRGKQTFASTCAGCHGLDGRGGERAPNIAENPKVQRLSDGQIFGIIENGVPGTGMPAFHSLARPDVQAVIAYLRSLQGAKRTRNLPGDPDRGETVFFGKAGCSGCHMAAGKGGFIASDLSGYARSHAAEQIRSAIISPNPSNDRQARMVTATTRGGKKYVGRIRNEDNFSLQLQTLDGRFYFVNKSDLEGLDSLQTLMPHDYGSTLSSDELNDVASYLMRVANASVWGTPTKVVEWEE